MIARNPSPLRYPGGKVSLTEVLRNIIYSNEMQGCIYVEPFAGGAGAGLKLLRDGHVDRIVINDADRAVFCFWNSVMKRTEELIYLVRHTPLSIREWHKQRSIYRNPGRCRQIELGFAAFYLNRCNRSGIIKNGGPIGGIKQAGEWKLDARFNRDALVARIEEISAYGDRVSVLNEDAADLLKNLHEYTENELCFVYADPPYYLKGRELYLSHYSDSDHETFAKLIRKGKRYSWIVSYDDVPRIRALYHDDQIVSFDLRYSAHKASSKGQEVLIAPSHVNITNLTRTLLTTRAGSKA